MKLTNICLFASSLMSMFIFSVIANVTKSKKYKNILKNIRLGTIKFLTFLLNFFAHDVNPLIQSIFKFNIFKNVQPLDNDIEPNNSNCVKVSDYYY